MTETPKCFKCSKPYNIMHHISYIPEITKPCCHECHNEIHRRVRKEGKCKFSVEEVERMSRKSTYLRANIKARSQHAEYAKAFQEKIDFLDKLEDHIYHREHICFNNNTGNVSVSCGFMTDGTIKLQEI